MASIYSVEEVEASPLPIITVCRGPLLPTEPGDDGHAPSEVEHPLFRRPHGQTRAYVRSQAPSKAEARGPVTPPQTTW